MPDGIKGVALYDPLLKEHVRLAKVSGVNRLPTSNPVISDAVVAQSVILSAQALDLSNQLKAVQGSLDRLAEQNENIMMFLESIAK